MSEAQRKPGPGWHAQPVGYSLEHVQRGHSGCRFPRSHRNLVRAKTSSRVRATGQASVPVPVAQASYRARSRPDATRMHLRTTNHIGSTFATVRHRARSPKARASAGLRMVFRLIESPQDRWCAVNAPHLVALARAGAAFVNGTFERPGKEPRPVAT
jgi:hypothetical protein